MPDISIKDEHMWRLANMLAHSGAYDGWLEIDHELNARGFPRARQLLAEESVRERLNRECTEARAKHPNAKSS
jgi:hypothetical protein